jgi:glycosyltransferase involved in cell wall biosynthesis
MKIIHIFPYSARCPGGHSNAIREFIGCQQDIGLDATGLSPSTSEIFSNDLGLANGISEMDFGDSAAVSLEINRLGSGSSVIVHLHGVDRFNTNLAAQARQDGHAVALTSHGQLNVRSRLHAVKKFIYLTICRSPVRFANGIHVLTHREHQRLRLLVPFYKGVITALPHVIHPPRALSQSGISNDLNSSPKPFTVINLGRLDVFTKGLDLLVEGFAKSGLYQAQLILAGPDWNNGRATLEKLATDLGCSQRVVFPGAVYGEEKERLLASADLFVAVSRWDAFNISLAEVLLRGVPAIVSQRLNLAPELARAGAAEVVPCSASALAATLETLSKDPARRKSLGTHGKAWVESHCAAEQVATEFVKFYEKIIETGGI